MWYQNYDFLPLNLSIMKEIRHENGVKDDDRAHMPIFILYFTKMGTLQCLIDGGSK